MVRGRVTELKLSRSATFDGGGPPAKPYRKSFIFLVRRMYVTSKRENAEWLKEVTFAYPFKLGGGILKPISLAGLALIVLGVIALAYQGITYTTQKKVLDVGPIQATKTEHKTIPLSPIFGGVALVGGIILMIAGAKEA